MKRVLFDGAAGDIGRRLRTLLRPIYPQLTLERREKARRFAERGSVCGAPSLAIWPRSSGSSKAAKASSTSAGIRSKAPGRPILNANIIGCRNLFEAARRKGVQRVVFASSNHAVGFYPRVKRIGTDVTVRPDTRYGLSKAFGEAWAHFMRTNTDCACCASGSATSATGRSTNVGWRSGSAPRTSCS